MELETMPKVSRRRRRANSKRRHEKYFLASIVDSSDDAIFAKDLNGIILNWNQGAERLYGYTQEEIIGKPVSILALPDREGEISEILERLKRGDRVEHFETVRKRKDGSLVNISLTVSPIQDERGHVIAASSIARDITDKKRAEDQIRAQLEEKSILVQEIYHRVKNNLQLICSLLDLRRRDIKDGNPNSAFKESVDRIRAMALVHEKMLESAAHSTIDLKEYVTGLFEPLEQAYIGSEKRIKLILRGDPCQVESNVAVPLGLIFNELITNSLKYAFPDGRPGEISIHIEAADRFATIVFRDNGIGFSEAIDFSTVQTFGLKIVGLLTMQLRGTIEVSGTAGATFKIRVPLNSAAAFFA